MLVLIVDDDHFRQAELAIAFMQAGFQTASTGSRAFAECFIQKGLVDLLVMTERVGGRLTHALSLLAEYQNPMVETVLLTPRCDKDIEELFSLLPSLHCLVAPDTSPTLVTKFAIAAVAGAQNRTGLPVLTAELETIEASAATSIVSTTGSHQRSTGELLKTA
jgi:hypothetical protein